MGVMENSFRPTATPPEIFSAALQLLEELTAISSPSGDNSGLQAAAECLGGAYRRFGFEIEIRPQPDDEEILRPVLYARGPAAGDDYLLIVGHLDTVLPASSPAIRGDRLFATGATDMKGGLVALAGALELLSSTDDLGAAADLLIAVTPDEEVGGRLTREIVEILGRSARGLWVLEPGRTESDGGADSIETMVIGRRGMFQWQLDVEGQAAHAGNGYWQGRSALNAAADWCLRARALAAPGPGPTVNAGRLVAGDSGFVDDLAAGAALVGTARQLNVVPDLARSEGEARFREAEEGEALRREMQRLAIHVGEEHEVKTEFRSSDLVRPAAVSEASRRWAQAAMAAAEGHGWRLRVEDDRPGISFPNFLPAGVEVPAIDGLGPVGGGMHTRDEHVELRSFDRRIALLADLLRAV